MPAASSAPATHLEDVSKVSGQRERDTVVTASRRKLSSDEVYRRRRRSSLTADAQRLLRHGRLSLRGRLVLVESTIAWSSTPHMTAQPEEHHPPRNGFRQIARVVA